MCCGGAADRVGTRFARYGRAARRGRPRPHGDPRSLWEIHISAPSCALAHARPRGDARHLASDLMCTCLSRRCGSHAQSQHHAPRSKWNAAQNYEELKLKCWKISNPNWDYT